MMMKIPVKNGFKYMAMGLLGLAGLFMQGCAQDDIQVYTVPKEGGGLASSAVKWVLPQGWIEKPAEGMRAGSFTIPGEGGEEADVSIIPLPSGSGSDLDNVNRWRGQVGLAPITQEQLSASSESVEVGGESSLLVDLSGTDPQTQKPSAILGVILPKANQTWFVKATGPPGLLAQSKSAFKEFLKSLSFEGGPVSSSMLTANQPPSTVSAAPEQSALAKPSWQVPKHWQELPPTAMLIAKFAVAGAESAQTAVTVSAFPGDVGGLYANVLRWRREINLPMISEDELGTVTSKIELETKEIEGTLVDMTNSEAVAGQKGQRLLVAILKHQGWSWFFKLVGDEAVVSQEKAAFLQFVHSVRYPNVS